MSYEPCYCGNCEYCRDHQAIHEASVIRRESPTGARPSEDARQIVEKHRRHVELSPGVGEDVQRYALAVLDDVLADFRRSPRLPSAEDSAPTWKEQVSRLIDAWRSADLDAMEFDDLVDEVADWVRRVTCNSRNGSM